MEWRRCGSRRKASSGATSPLTFSRDAMQMHERIEDKQPRLQPGLLSNFLTRALRARGVPIVCLDARHAKTALRVQINKTDANDAYGLAQVVRTGWFREIAVKSMDAQSLRLLLVARAQLVSQRQAIANTLRGLLKAFGHVVRKGAGGLFARRVRDVCYGNPALCAIAEPMLAVWQSLREQIRVLDRQLLKRAKSDPATQRLMSIPAVGVIVALAYGAVIDNPERFRRSSTVGAYLGLTPRRYQSGDVDCAGHISKCGDGLLRAYAVWENDRDFDCDGCPPHA
jgi:transposase